MEVGGNISSSRKVALPLDELLLKIDWDLGHVEAISPAVVNVNELFVIQHG